MTVVHQGDTVVIHLIYAAFTCVYAWLFYRLWRLRPNGETKRLHAKCRRAYRAAHTDVVIANTLQRRVWSSNDRMTWHKACRQLSKHGAHKALVLIRKPGNEEAAEELFTIAHQMLMRQRDAAEAKLKAATALLHPNPS